MNDQAQSLREMVGRTENAAAALRQRARPPAKVICVTSGKGGVGKSFLTVNLALALSRLDLKVLIIDADFGLANVDIMLGRPARYNLSHLLRRERSMAEIVEEWQGGIKYISGGNGLSELLRMSEAQLTQTIEEMLLLSGPLDIILCDTGAGVNETVLRVSAAAHEIILVSTPEPTAILDAYALLKTLGLNGVTANIRLLMNKAASPKEAENAINSFVGISKKYLDKQIEALGCILYDGEVGQSIKRQTPLLLAQPKSATARDISALAGTLAGLPTQHKPSGQLAKLFFRWLTPA